MVPRSLSRLPWFRWGWLVPAPHHGGLGWITRRLGAGVRGGSLTRTSGCCLGHRQPELPYNMVAGFQGQVTQRARQSHLAFVDLDSHAVPLPPHPTGQGSSKGQPGFKGREHRSSLSVAACHCHSVRRAGRMCAMDHRSRETDNVWVFFPLGKET